MKFSLLLTAAILFSPLAHAQSGFTVAQCESSRDPMVLKKCESAMQTAEYTTEAKTASVDREIASVKKHHKKKKKSKGHHRAKGNS